jgi:hypothetical protein
MVEAHLRAEHWAEGNLTNCANEGGMNSQVELWDDLNDQRRNRCPIAKIRLAGLEEKFADIFCRASGIGLFEH